MIRYVVCYKRKKDGKTGYRVGYTTREVKYTSDNVPKTVKNFIASKPYMFITDTSAIFR